MRFSSFSIAGWLCCLIATHNPAEPTATAATSVSDAVFEPTRVVNIELRLDPKDWLALRISHPVLDEEGRISVTEKGYQYRRADVIIDGHLIKSVGVRKKGAWGSLNSARPSLKIKFDEYTKKQTFQGLETLTLNNCLSDPTKARQFLAYSFMRRASVPSPLNNLAHVAVNGEDLGIYANVESIGKAFIQRHFENAQGDLYENVGTADLTTNLMHHIAHKWGKDNGHLHLKKLVDTLETPGPLSLPAIEESVDLDAFITFWAAEVLVGHPDSYPAMFNNFYMYREARSGKFHFIPWGTDAVFVDRQYGGPAVPKSVKAAGYLCERLWELPTIQERYRKELRRLLEEAWDEKGMLAELDQIRGLCQNDPIQDSVEAKESAARIVQFVETRHNELQPELDGPPPTWTAMRRRKPKEPADTNAPMRLEGAFSAVIVESFPLNPATYLPFPTNRADYFGLGTATLEFTVKGRTHKPFTQYGAAAINKSGPGQATFIRISASDAVGDLLWNVLFYIDPYCVTPGMVRQLEPWLVTASVIQGDPHSSKAQSKWFLKKNGTLELAQVSTNLGGIISGKFQINTTAFEEEKKP